MPRPSDVIVRTQKERRNFEQARVWRARAACRQYGRRNYRVAGPSSPHDGHTVGNQRDDGKRDRVQELRCRLFCLGLCL